MGRGAAAMAAPADAKGAPESPPRAWGVYDDGDGQGQYFYCRQVELSTWTRHLDLPPDVTPEKATDEQLWVSLYDRQIREAFKMCSVCASPRETFDNPFFVCGTCSRHCHLACSGNCAAVVCSEVWSTYAPYLRSCDVCEGRRQAESRFVEGGPTADQMSVSSALSRLKSVQLPHAVRDKLQSVEESYAGGKLGNDAGNDRVADIMTNHYCPRGSHRLFTLQTSPSKGGGIGVFTTAFVPRLTRVGIYPGYPDPLSGEQSQKGRPTPKYALAEFNAADYYNKCFPELRGCLTQFINEPAPTEGSNVAWLQESSAIIEPGRLSIVTTRDLAKGEELLLSYGPLYPRDYPYAYDAYSFHPVSEDPNELPGVYALWYYASREAEAELKGYIKYESHTDQFVDCTEHGAPLSINPVS